VSVSTSELKNGKDYSYVLTVATHFYPKLLSTSEPKRSAAGLAGKLRGSNELRIYPLDREPCDSRVS
jgi:hypothetical protein